eukprot:scaffold90740_cov63-Phaeocystis_antarctica.AAC.2
MTVGVRVEVRVRVRVRVRVEVRVRVKVARVLLKEVLVGQEERGEAEQAGRQVDDGDAAVAAVGGAHPDLRVEEALAPQHGVVGARDGLDGLTVLEQQQELLLDERGVDRGVSRDDVGRERGAVAVAPEDQTLAHAVRHLLILLVGSRDGRGAPLRLGALSQAIAASLARVQGLLVEGLVCEPVVVEELLVAGVVVERVGRVPEHLQHVAARGGEDRVVGVVVVGAVPPLLPPVPHELDVGVVALARLLRAAGLLVGQVDHVVRLAELVQPIRVGVGRGLAAHVGVAGGGRADGEGNPLALWRDQARGGVAQDRLEVDRVVQLRRQGLQAGHLQGEAGALRLFEGQLGPSNAQPLARADGVEVATGEEGGLHQQAGGQGAGRVHRAGTSPLLVHVEVREEAAAVPSRRELLGEVPERCDHLAHGIGRRLEAQGGAHHLGHDAHRCRVQGVVLTKLILVGAHGLVQPLVGPTLRMRHVLALPVLFEPVEVDRVVVVPRLVIPRDLHRVVHALRNVQEVVFAGVEALSLHAVLPLVQAL